MRASLVVGIAVVLVVGCARPPAYSTASTPQLYRPAAEPEVTPPSLVTPTPPSRTRSYAWKVAMADLALFASLVPVVGRVEDESQEQANWLGVAYAAAFVFGVPLIHLLEDNSEQWSDSVGMRLGYPVLGGAVGLGIAGLAMGFECDSELCFLPYFFGAIVGAGVGVVAAAIHDWTQAKIDF